MLVTPVAQGLQLSSQQGNITMRKEKDSMGELELQMMHIMVFRQPEHSKIFQYQE